MLDFTSNEHSSVVPSVTAIYHRILRPFLLHREITSSFKENWKVSVSRFSNNGANWIPNWIGERNSNHETLAKFREEITKLNYKNHQKIRLYFHISSFVSLKIPMKFKFVWVIIRSVNLLVRFKIRDFSRYSTTHFHIHSPSNLPLHHVYLSIAHANIAN